VILELARIQLALNAPKGQFNEFSQFSYRSAEDILKAVKPLLNGLVLRLDDDVKLIGDRYYVVASATITDGKEVITSKAFAREELTKKGMDAAQITGSASSYARKYALSALFAVTDGQDLDGADHSETAQTNFQEEFKRVATAIGIGETPLIKNTWSELPEPARNAIWNTLTSVQRETLTGAMK